MSLFQNAFQPRIESCTFYEIGGDANLVTVNKSHGPSSDVLIIQQGIKTLYKHSASDASHNSQARFPPPRCHPETRDAILHLISQWIQEWLENYSGVKTILWIYGPAGAGKSAIAQTISETFAERQALAASFFFARGKDRRGTSNHLVATIAYQLTNAIPELREDIGKAVARDPSILSLSIDIQILRLIVQPLHSVFTRTTTTSRQRYLIIIDGLDECDGDDSQLRVLTHVAELCHHYDLPFTIFISSREEPHIADSMRQDPRISKILQEFHLGPSDRDIYTFLARSFDEIRRTHSALSSLKKPWPSKSDLEKLVYRSSGYFIYASTVIKFIGDKDMNPIQSLNGIISCNSTPLTALDDLYHEILSTVPLVWRPRLISILEILVAARVFPTKAYSRNLDELLGLPEGNSMLILRRMHSLLDNIDSNNDVIHIVHKSFLDFLNTKDRSGSFYVNASLGHARIATTFARCARDGVIHPSFSQSWWAHASRSWPHDLGIMERARCAFLEDIQAVSIGTWKKWIEGDIWWPASEQLEDTIVSLDIQFGPLVQEVIQLLTNLLDPTYLQELNSGELCPMPLFVGEPDSMETFNESVNVGNIIICRKHHDSLTYEHIDHLGAFILDKTRCGRFLFNPSIGHAHAFDLCMQYLLYRPPGDIYDDPRDKDGFSYAKIWWTFHLSQCSPDHHDGIEIIEELVNKLPEFEDVEDSERVIAWLKGLHEPREPLISRWEDYQQNLLRASQGDSPSYKDMMA